MNWVLKNKDGLIKDNEKRVLLFDMMMAHN